MSQTIKRKAKGVRRAASARGTAQKVKKARAKTGSFIDALMRFLPFTEEQLHRIFLRQCPGIAYVIGPSPGAEHPRALRKVQFAFQSSAI